MQASSSPISRIVDSLTRTLAEIGAEPEPSKSDILVMRKPVSFVQVCILSLEQAVRVVVAISAIALRQLDIIFNLMFLFVVRMYHGLYTKLCIIWLYAD